MRLLTIFFLLLGLVFSKAAMASDWYQVELLVFAPTQTQTSEHWNRNTLPDYDHQAITLSSSSPHLPANASAADRAAANQGAWHLKSRNNSLTVAKMGSSMAYRGEYRTLFYGRWVQPLTTDNNSLPIHISGGHPLSYAISGEHSRELEGTITLTRSRYLHLATDLWFASNADSKDFFAHINESRRLKNGELHYLDNPLFGIMIQVTRLK